MPDFTLDFSNATTFKLLFPLTAKTHLGLCIGLKVLVFNHPFFYVAFTTRTLTPV